jgi:hypothetical protein
MKKISFWKKAKLYFTYRNILIQNKPELEQKFGARIDNISRIYTVLNIPQNLIDEPYNIRKSDIDNISKQYIKEYSTEISRYLDSIGANELYDFYQVEKVDKYSYLLVFGFSLINTDDFAKKFLFRYIPISVLLIVLSILFLF